jgi:two-component system, NarL family, response regulator LiaR
MATSNTRHRKERPFKLIRVMVVDDHARVRHGLRLFLSTCPGIEVVAAAGDGAEALKLFAAACPDVVIMDLATPGMDSLVVTSRMKELRPASKIITLASFVDAEMEHRALEAGAARCVVKDSSAGALVEAIREGCRRTGNGHMTFVQAKSGVSAELEDDHFIRCQRQGR